MILTYGDVSTLQNHHWYIAELRSEKTIESTLKRLATALPSIFRESSIELFIPIKHRDIHQFDLSTGNYIFVRSRNFQALLRLKSITGVVGLVTEGDSNHPSKAIPLDNEYVQTTIKETERLFLERAKLTMEGSFVRILDGEHRDFCGHVIDLRDNIAHVSVQIKTKILVVATPVRNLRDLSDVPPNLRVFYYSPSVQALVKSEETDLVKEDLAYEEDPLFVDDGLHVTKSMKLGRQQTVTALVKRLIITGTLTPKVIAMEVVTALKEGRLKTPKNLSIVHGIIKHRLIVDHFKRQHPGIVNYREVVALFGAEWKFPLHEFVTLAEGLDLPVSSPDGGGLTSPVS